MAPFLNHKIYLAGTEVDFYILVPEINPEIVQKIKIELKNM
jgi:hypothetical protein